MDNVLVSINVMLDVNVLKRDSGGVFRHHMVEENLRISIM